MYRNMVAQAHTLLKQSGSPLVSDENIYNNLSATAKDMGLAPNDIFTHPDDAPPQQPQQDPAILKLQGELQLKQQQLMAQQQADQAKLALMAQKGASDAQIAQARMESESQLALRQQNIDAFLQAHEMALEAHKQAHDMKLAANANDAKVKSLRRGGKLNK
jgi:hypothetical protein